MYFYIKFLAKDSFFGNNFKILCNTLRIIHLDSANIMEQVMILS